jgi:hypothetical protein
MPFLPVIVAPVAALFAALLESLAGCGEGTAARFAYVARAACLAGLLRIGGCCRGMLGGECERRAEHRHLRSADCLEKCLLSGVTWKTLLALSSSQFDPMCGPAVRCKVDVAELAVSGLVTFTHRRAPMVPTLSRGCICW